MQFLKRLKQIDPELAAQAEREISKMREMQGENRARRNLAETIDRFSDDATGQDGEDEIEAAAEDYIDSQNDRIRRTDPDRYSEMRAMGLL